MTPPRLTYPDHEARHPWLTGLLNAYHLADEACRAEIARETARRGEPPACGPGCSVCCTGQVIPVSAFEALGLWWYAAEVMPPEPRQGLRENLLAHARAADSAPACVFLVAGKCSAYALRPIICRGHHVYGRACRPGENLRMERPGDVVSTGRESARAMAWELIPLYGVPHDDIDRRFESGYVASRSLDLHSLPLWNLLIHMDNAERRGRNA